MSQQYFLYRTTKTTQNRKPCPQEQSTILLSEVFHLSKLLLPVCVWMWACARGGGGGGHDHFQKLALSFPAHPSQLLCLFLASPRLLSPSQLWSIHSGGFLCISASCQTHLWALHSLNLPTNWATRRRNFFPPPASHAPSRSYLGEKAGTHSIEHSLDAPRGNSAVWKLCNVNNWCTWEVVIKLVNYAGKITCNYVTAGYV